MSDTMQKVTRFTQDQMDTIMYAIASQGEVAGVVATWDILLGEPLETYEGEVNPNRYAIPKDQSDTIWGSIVARERLDATHDGMVGGTWMNAGPMTFTEGS